MYYNPGYNNINFNLWVFINNSHYGYDNYANYMLGRDYTRHVFDRRLVRISNRQIERTVLERIVRQKIRVTSVDVRELQTDRQKIRVVVPTGTDSITRIRKNSKDVVRNIIAPGFAEKQKSFKGQNSKNKDVVSKLFQQEKVAPKVENLSAEQVINRARAENQKREQNRKKIELAEKEKLVKIEKEGKIKEPRKEKSVGKPGAKGPAPEGDSKLQKSDKAQKPPASTKQQQREIKQTERPEKKQQDVRKQNDPVKQRQQGQKEQLESPQKESPGKEIVKSNETESPDEQVKSDKKIQKKPAKKEKAKSKPKKKDQEKDKDED